MSPSAPTARIEVARHKTKSFTVQEYELLGVEREPGKAAFALLAEPGTGKYVGSAFISLGRDMKERL
ncbi:hypothetical protein NKJ51_32565 [Mesorhizobium sp. M0134]|uniref:hypothetical protein n=1 Tax=Mesorhizobium sp. M0134 TaxID=2956889 RepID=UPI00333AEA3F